MRTGSTSGRRPDRFLKNLRSSPRSFIRRISPGSHALLDAGGVDGAAITPPRRRKANRPDLAADDEAARDELGLADERAGLPVDRHDRDDHPVAREVTPIAQHLVADFADPRDVDEHAARGRLAGDPRATASNG